MYNNGAQNMPIAIAIVEAQALEPSSFKIELTSNFPKCLDPQ